VVLVVWCDLGGRRAARGPTGQVLAGGRGAPVGAAVVPEGGTGPGWCWYVWRCCRER